MPNMYDRYDRTIHWRTVLIFAAATVLIVALLIYCHILVPQPRPPMLLVRVCQHGQVIRYGDGPLVFDMGGGDEVAIAPGATLDQICK